MIEEAKAREAGGTDVAARQATAKEIDRLITKLPRKDQIEAGFTRDWMNSSQDGWDIDMGGTKAGYIFVRATYYDRVDAPSEWKLDHDPYIDDASNPDGIITALTNVFGADAPLELLPVRMVVSAYVETESPGEPKRHDRRWGAELVSRETKSPDLRSTPAWMLGDGDPSFLVGWLAERPGADGQVTRARGPVELAAQAAGPGAADAVRQRRTSRPGSARRPSRADPPPPPECAGGPAASGPLGATRVREAWRLGGVRGRTNGGRGLGRPVE